MSLSSVHAKLHNLAVEACAEHRRLEAKLLELLIQIERQKIFKFLGYSSMFNYAVKALGLSEATAYSFITVARKCGECTELLSSIENEKLSVSKASRIVSALGKENSLGLIEFAKTHASRQIDYEVARLRPEEQSIKDRTKPISQDQGELKCVLPLEALTKLERVRSLLSSKLGRAVSIGEALDRALEDCLEKRDPVIRAKRVLARKTKIADVRKTHACRTKTPEACTQAYQEEVYTTEACQVDIAAGGSDQKESGQPSNSVQTERTSQPATNSARTEKTRRLAASRTEKTGNPARTRTEFQRKPLAAAQRHAVNARDEGRCTFIDPNTGERCCNDRWTQIHHKKPISRGGTNDPNNLTTLCSAHHNLVHQLSLPLEGQVSWLRQRQVSYKTGS